MPKIMPDKVKPDKDEEDVVDLDLSEETLDELIRISNEQNIPIDKLINEALKEKRADSELKKKKKKKKLRLD